MAIPIKSRMPQKHDIEANWLKATNFIPMQGEIIVYDVDSNYTYERFKIGDGIKTVNNLPFVIDEALAQAQQSGIFDGKSAYEFAQEGGFTGTEEEFAERLALDPTVFYVIIEETDEGYTADRTFLEIQEAFLKHRNVYAIIPNRGFLASFVAALNDNQEILFESIIGTDTVGILITKDNEVFVEILPLIHNIQPLNINLIEANDSITTMPYDGSEQKEIIIPTVEKLEIALAGVVEKAKELADWDNISNKPFGIIKGETVLPLTEVIYIRDDPNNVDYNVSLPLFDIIIGETYQITFNGQDYNCVSQEFISNNGFLGNAHIAFSSLPDTGEPFFIVQEGSDKKIKLKIKHSLEATTTKITLGVKKLDRVKYLDNKYLDFLHAINSYNNVFPLTELTVEESGESYITEPLPLLKETFYNITINENSYTCQSIELEVDGASFLVLGNLAFVNNELYENTNEPFIILCPPEPVEGIYAVFMALGFGSDIALQIDQIETNYQLKDNILSTETPVIKNASAGQVVSIKTVDENGKPTEWEAVSAGSNVDLTGYATEEYVNAQINAIPDSTILYVIIQEDDEGVATADRTYFEILEAFQQGRNVYALMPSMNRIFPISGMDENGRGIFTSHADAQELFIAIDQNNNVEIWEENIADWNKLSNRPFEVIEESEIISPLTTIEYNSSFAPILCSKLIPNKVYQITLNDKCYNSVVITLEGENVYMGNLHAVDLGYPDTGEPFAIIQFKDDNEGIITFLSLEESFATIPTNITVGIKKLEIIKYLDNKYLDFLHITKSHDSVFPLTELALNEGMAYITEPLSLLKETPYDIIINGNSYICQSTEVHSNGISGLALGNLGLIDSELFENTNEPFVLACTSEPVDGLYGIFAASGFGSNVTLQVDEINYQLKDNALSTKVPVIKNASVGQVVTVKAVDESGKPTEWEAQDITSIEGLATEQYVQNYVNETILGGAW